MRIFMIFLCLLMASASLWAQSRVALVIGNADYTHDPLRNPVNDALDMAAMLSAYGFQVIGYDDRRKRLRTLNLNHQEMEKAVLDFKEALTKGSVGLFFYAGHAMQDAEQQNYLIPVKTDIPDSTLIKHRAINAQWVLDVMASKQTHLNIVVLDACRNNPFRSFFRSAKTGLAEMGTPSGTIITYATQAGGLAADGNGGRNGLYTGELLAAMQQGGLTIEQIFKQTAQKVRIAAEQIDHKQEPWIGMSYTGDFCFGQCLPSQQELMQQLQNLQTQMGGGQQNNEEVLRRLQALEQQILKSTQQAVIPQPPPPVEALIPTENLIKDRYRDHGDGTVTDIETNLQWMRCLIGQEWQNGRCQGEPQKMNSDKAQELKINFAGHRNWRLPTIKELRGLVYCSSGKPAYFPNNGKVCEGDYQRPTLIQEAFPDAPEWFVWSGSPVSGGSDYAWNVYFFDGFGDNYYRNGNRHVRLVRGGQ
ncbi:caspase family protein [Thioflexithrix psekupsensis]|uniref:Caspase family p20 domain-containing protein n=1 Tax=Thioflexithrix psekupsensis TaxID=1570016 RepID=A0A251XAD5_9GAMM|nr:caspase family protein [Thioflexithrix psekupsensis]OUD14482.1 hypothetical protein TPSD3_09275 [Thioflexithrix psekupsensis]